MALALFYLIRNWFASLLSWGRFYNFQFQKISISAIEGILVPTEYADSAKRERYRWGQFRKILKKFSRHNRFYASLLHKRGLNVDAIRMPEDIAMLPILNKQIMRGLSVAEIISKGINKKRVGIDTTSGSTGETFAFALDQKFSPFLKANFYRPWRRAGADPYAPVVNCAGRRLAKATPNTLYLSPERMHLELEKYAEAIRKSGARSIRGSPLTNFELVKTLRDSGYLDISFQYAFLYGSTLPAGIRRYFHEQLGCEAFDMYGLQEFGIVAAECQEHKGMHIFEESFILEIISEKERVLPSGEFGTILITTLLNEITPFIRYAPGDRGKIITEPCSCGRTSKRLLLEGRNEELLVRPDGARISSMAIREIMYKFFNSFERYQVYQPSINHVLFSVMPTRQFQKQNLEQATQELHELLGPSMKLEAKIVASIPFTGKEKFRFIISDISNTDTYYFS